MGRHHTLLCPCGVFKAHQGYVAILVTPGQWAGMCKALGQPELENDPRFDSLESRAKNQNELIPPRRGLVADLSERPGRA